MFVGVRECKAISKAIRDNSRNRVPKFRRVSRCLLLRPQQPVAQPLRFDYHRARGWGSKSLAKQGNVGVFPSKRDVLAGPSQSYEQRNGDMRNQLVLGWTEIAESSAPTSSETRFAPA